MKKLKIQLFFKVSALLVLSILVLSQPAYAARWRLKFKVVGDCASAFNRSGLQISDIEEGTLCTLKAIVRKSRKKNAKGRYIWRRAKGVNVFMGEFSYREPVDDLRISETNKRGAVQFQTLWDNSRCWYSAALDAKFTKKVKSITVVNSADDFCKCGCV